MIQRLSNNLGVYEGEAPPETRQLEVDGYAVIRGVFTADDVQALRRDRKSTRLNSSHLVISYAVFCLKKKKSNLTAQFQDSHQNQAEPKVHSHLPTFPAPSPRYMATPNRSAPSMDVVCIPSS